MVYAINSKIHVYDTFKTTNLLRSYLNPFTTLMRAIVKVFISLYCDNQLFRLSNTLKANYMMQQFVNMHLCHYNLQIKPKIYTQTTHVCL